MLQSIQQILTGVQTLVQSIPILLSNPTTLFFGVFRLPIVALWIYLIASTLWLLLYPFINIISTLTNYEFATKDGIVRGMAAFSAICAQFFFLKITCISTTSAIWQKSLQACDLKLATTITKSPILRPLSSILCSILTKVGLAVLFLCLFIPICVVAAPLTILGGSVALVPAVVVGMSLIVLSLFCGGGGLLWHYIGRPITMLLRAFETVWDVAVLIALLLVIQFAFNNSATPQTEVTFVSLIMMVAKCATTFHLSVLLAESLMAQVQIRTSLKTWNEWRSKHRFVLFGFGIVPYLCFQHRPLLALACLELFQGAAAVLVVNILKQDEQNEQEGKEMKFLFANKEEKQNNSKKTTRETNHTTYYGLYH